MRSSKASVWPAGTSSRVGNKKTIGSRQAIRFNCLDGETNVRRRRRRTEMEEKLGEDVSLSLSLEKENYDSSSSWKRQKKKKTSGHSWRWSSAMSSSSYTLGNTQTHKPTQTIANTSVMALHLFSVASLYTMLLYSPVDMFLYIHTSIVCTIRGIYRSL